MMKNDLSDKKADLALLCEKSLGPFGALWAPIGFSEAQMIQNHLLRK